MLVCGPSLPNPFSAGRGHAADQGARREARRSDRGAVSFGPGLPLGWQAAAGHNASRPSGELAAVRTLPVRVAPVCGEALDSWLEALAVRMAACWGDVVESVGLISAGADSARDCVAGWLRGLSAAQVLAVSTATGISAEQVASMTFQGVLNRAAGSGGLRGSSLESLLWMRGWRCRFCAACLSENGGRWALWWRLRWAFACPHHHCLLVDVCPMCHRSQRAEPPPSGLIPLPGGCTRKRLGSHGRHIARCDGELTAADGLPLGPDHPVLGAQRALLEAMQSGWAGFGVYRRAPIPFSQLIADIAAVGGRILGYATRDELRGVLPGDVVDQYLDDRAATGAAGGRASRVTASATASAAAVAATAAWSILSALTVVDAGGRLRWLVASSRRRGVAVRASTLGWGRGISPVLAAVQLAALEPFMAPIDQLRHRTTGAYPTSTGDEARAGCLPALVWPRWSLPLRCPGVGHRELRAALSVAIALVGTRAPLAEVVGALGSVATVRRALRVLQHLHASPRWAQTRSDITAWAAYLDAAPPPIDYRRRRTLPCTDLLPVEVWRDLCLSVGVGPGRAVRLQLMRCWLHERLTTLPAESCSWAVDSADFRGKLAALPLWLTAELVAALDDYAREFLADNGIRSEPVVAGPPGVVSGGRLAGDDGGGVDVDALHRWIGRHQPRSFAAVAAHFGVDTDAVRYLLEEAPTPSAVVDTGGSSGGSVASASRRLSPEQFDYLYNECRWGLATIAAEAGVSRQALTQLAQRYGIAVRRAGRPIGGAMSRTSAGRTRGQFAEGEG